MSQTRVLILGITGMLGHKLFTRMSCIEGMQVYGTARSMNVSGWLPAQLLDRVQFGVDADNFETVKKIIRAIKPDWVINCVGIIKQLPVSEDIITTLKINALFPHRVASICQASGARLIHISTDCVFDGATGNYIEDDMSNATDLYGRTKYLGEVYYPHCITLRTSIIGHELNSKYGLLEWFISQQSRARGYVKAVFSGFPTVELERIIREYVIPNQRLNGLYHVSSNPVSKYELLKKIAARYGKHIDIDPCHEFACDRSLNSEKFRQATGYIPPEWPNLIDDMYLDYISGPYTGNFDLGG